MTEVDWSYVEEHGPIACQVFTPVEGREWMQDHYTCYSCNKSWNKSDPGFTWFKVFGDYGWVVRAGLARPGDWQCLVWVEEQKEDGDYRPYWKHLDPVSGGYDALGWFARCVDEEACAERRYNNHNDQHEDQLILEVA